MEEFFFAMIPITLFLTVGGVLVLRPLTKRLGLLIEASARAKGTNVDAQLQIDQLRLVVETQNLRLEQLDQKLAFAESLLEARTQGYLAGRRATSGMPQELS